MPSKGTLIAALAVTAACWTAVPPTAAAARHKRHARTAAAARIAPAPSARAIPAQRPAPSSPVGHVQFVTDKRAYLDRGSLHGLEPRQAVPISRGGRVVGTCTVETVAERLATCVGGRPRVGDTFRAPARAAARNGGAPPPELPPPVDDFTLETRAAVIASAPVEQVEFTGKPAFRSGSTASVSPGFATWHNQPDPNGDYSQERIDGAVSAMIGSTGMRFDASFSAMRWRTPPALERFRPGTQSQFYLWEAETSRRQTDASTVFAVGRLWPWHTPGLTLLDGFQLGRQNEAHTAEGGVYGGLIPTALGLAPTMDIWAAGLYGALTETGSNRSPFRLARQEARVGVWRGPLAGLVGEAEALGQVWLGPARLGGGGRLRLAPSVAAQPVVERAYVDLGLQPVPSLGAALHVRYFGASLLDEEAALRALTPNLSGGVSALADAHWEAQSWVGVAGYGDAHRDAQTGMGRFHGAAEIRFPRALGEVGGVWLGAEAEEGWMRGRGYYVQLVGRLADRVQALARASANTSEFTTPDARPNVRELGAYLHLDGALASWVRLRAWSLLRVPFLVQDAPPGEAAPGVVFGSSLTGVF